MVTVVLSTIMMLQLQDAYGIPSGPNKCVVPFSPGNDYSNCNFVGTSVVGGDCRNCNFSNVGFGINSSFKNVNFDGANFSGAGTHNWPKSGVDFSGSSFRNAIFTNGAWKQAKFFNTNFSGASFNSVLLPVSDYAFKSIGLDGANFSHATLHKVGFVNNGLYAATIDAVLGVDLSQYSGCGPGNAPDTAIRNANFYNAKLTEIKFGFEGNNRDCFINSNFDHAFMDNWAISPSWVIDTVTSSTNDCENPSNQNLCYPKEYPYFENAEKLGTHIVLDINDCVPGNPGQGDCVYGDLYRQTQTVEVYTDDILPDGGWDVSSDFITPVSKVFKFNHHNLPVTCDPGNAIAQDYGIHQFTRCRAVDNQNPSHVLVQFNIVKPNPVISVSNIAFEVPSTDYLNDIDTTPSNTEQATVTDFTDPSPSLVYSDVLSDYPDPQILKILTRTWTATDFDGFQDVVDQEIIFKDTTPPVITLIPVDVEMMQTAFLTPIEDIPLGVATATDIFAVTITNDAPTVFQTGDTIVTWTATDEHGNSSTGTQTITILADLVLPEFVTSTLVNDIISEATGPNGAIVQFQIPSAIDDIDSSPIVTCDPDSDSTFPLGQTIVTCTAKDFARNQVQSQFSVTIEDTTPPILDVPTDTTLGSFSPDFLTNGDVGTLLAGMATASDLTDTQNISDSLYVVNYPDVVQSFNPIRAEMSCNPGDKAISGGGIVNQGYIQRSGPSFENTWGIVAESTDASEKSLTGLSVLCAKSPLAEWIYTSISGQYQNLASCNPGDTVISGGGGYMHAGLHASSPIGADKWFYSNPDSFYQGRVSSVNAICAQQGIADAFSFEKVDFRLGNDVCPSDKIAISAGGFVFDTISHIVDPDGSVRYFQGMGPGETVDNRWTTIPQSLGGDDPRVLDVEFVMDSYDYSFASGGVEGGLSVTSLNPFEATAICADPSFGTPTFYSDTVVDDPDPEIFAVVTRTWTATDPSGNVVSGTQRITVEVDSDEDGVSDSLDSCPTIFGLGLDGCTIDSDGDGVSDSLDSCPTIFGLGSDGCTNDTDGDGIVDSQDNCIVLANPDQSYNPCTCFDKYHLVEITNDELPRTSADGHANAQGFAEFYLGTNLATINSESDNDCAVQVANGHDQVWIGLFDYTLQDQFNYDNSNVPGCYAWTSESSADYTNFAGGLGDYASCSSLPPDTDGDGILDNVDACPTEYGTQPNGCPLDSDGDGIPDNSDACPFEPGPAPSGCPQGGGGPGGGNPPDCGQPGRPPCGASDTASDPMGTITFVTYADNSKSQIHGDITFVQSSGPLNHPPWAFFLNSQGQWDRVDHPTQPLYFLVDMPITSTDDFDNDGIPDNEDYCIGDRYGGDGDYDSIPDCMDPLVIIDEELPVITVPENITIEAAIPEGAIVEFAVTATDNDLLVSDPRCTFDSGDIFPIGLTSVTCFTVDRSNNFVSGTFSINVQDVIDPLIFFNDGSSDEIQELVIDAQNNSIVPSVTLEATNVLTPKSVLLQGTGLVIFDVSPYTLTNDAPDEIPLGDIIVTWTVTDSSGNTATAIQTVTIQDTTFPILIIPYDITTDATGVTTSVDIGVATAADAFPVEITNNAPDEFDIGSTIVTWTATDANDHVSTADQTVTIQDTIPPHLTVPTNITVEATGVTTPVDIGVATAADAFPVEITNNAPDEFDIGSTIVTWTATDLGGNSVTADQSVTVQDTTPPHLTVPTNITVEATGFATPVDIGVATATDAFPVEITNNAPDEFELGSTIVTWTATDENDNLSTVDQIITIEDTTPPVVTDPNDIVVSASGQTTFVNIGTATATDIFAIESITNDAPNLFALGTTEVHWTATDVNGNSETTLTQTITVEDTSPPAFIFPEPIVDDVRNFCDIDSTEHDAFFDTNVHLTDFRDEIIDICTLENITEREDVIELFVGDNFSGDVLVEAESIDGAIVNYVVIAVDDVEVTNESCDPLPGLFPIGLTIVECTATDAAGNSVSGSFTIDVFSVDYEPPVLDFTDVTVPTKPGESFADPQPILDEDKITDNVGIDVDSFSGTINGIDITTISPLFPVGIHQVELSVSDAAGNIGSVSFTVTVVDQEDPIFNQVISDITVEATSLAGDTVSFTVPTADDNADGIITSVCTPVSGSTFPLGDTTVTCTATDTAGNFATATSTVTVVDTTAPVITAPADVTAEATGVQTLVSTDSATATDAVGIVTITSDTPVDYGVGLFTITWTATDTAGNFATATSTVTVVDTTPPVITAPAAQSFEATAVLSPLTQLDYGTATGSDIFTPVVITDDAPATFALGDTTITWTATDANGLTNTATQIITVQDTTAPVIPVRLEELYSEDDEGIYRVILTATDAVDPNPSITANINGITVTNNQLVKLEIDDESESKFKEAKEKQCIKNQEKADKKIAKGKTISAELQAKLLICDAGGILQIEDLSFTLSATATDASGNGSTGAATPTFTPEVDDDEDESHDDDSESDNDDKKDKKSKDKKDDKKDKDD